jgi:Cu/Ag efflux pump CusA
MGGLVVATLLTLVFLPALYVTWFKIKPQTSRDRTETVPAVAVAA